MTLAPRGPMGRPSIITRTKESIAHSTALGLQIMQLVLYNHDFLLHRLLVAFGLFHHLLDMWDGLRMQ